MPIRAMACCIWKWLAGPWANVRMNLRYGFVGLGNLGRHLAVNLARGGFDVGVHDLQRGTADPVLAAGAHWVDSVPELAKTCD